VDGRVEPGHDVSGQKTSGDLFVSRMTLFSSSAMLTPFRVRSFRFQWPADLLTSWGIEMENLVLGWYILPRLL